MRKQAAPATRALPSYPVRPGVTIPDWSAVSSSVVTDALRAMFESEHVGRRWHNFTPDEDRVRIALLRLYAEHGRAPDPAELATRTGLKLTEVAPLLVSLRRRDIVVLDAVGKRIVGAYPFADCDTCHRVSLVGRAFNAMCAVDALGIGAMYGRDIEIDSRCGKCGVPIRVTTRNRGRALADVEPRSAVVWLGGRYEGGCAASSLCAVTAFFCAQDHLDVWRRTREADEPGFRLTIDEALEAGRAIFGPSLAGAALASDPGAIG